MKVYLNNYHQSRGRHTIFVQPGLEHPEIIEWVDSEGNAIMFPIIFENGICEINDNLGNYLLDKKYAKKTKLIIPEGH